MNSQLDEIAARLRQIRRARTLTLSAIEHASHGKINAISLGSYERGDRALTVKKAIDIAQFYEIPLSYLLTGISPSNNVSAKIVIDLRKAKVLLQQSNKDSSGIERITLSFISGIIKARQDFNGEVLSLREKDCDYLAITIGCSHDDIVRFLDQHNLLIKAR
jgi:transcriptional regulator with XRE-family HTH domain